MDHVNSIKKKKEVLIQRAKIIRLIREFFWEKNFLDVETPNLVALPGQEPHLSPIKLVIHDEKGKSYDAYLHTSPEYTLKKMLAAGFENIFSITKCFRDYESFGGLHNPEFTIAEWYRAHADFWAIMDDVTSLYTHLQTVFNALPVVHTKKIHMRDLWRETIGVDLGRYLNRDAMLNLCKTRGYHPLSDEPYEDVFYRIFLNDIEPKIKDYGSVIIHHYPAPMAALARLSEKDLGYAERFEWYVNGIELANAFSELTDAGEQQKRLEDEQQTRKKLGKMVYPIDTEFIDAVGNMPESAGIALGIDRLIQVILSCKNIDDVLVLPVSGIY
ncbi:MAG: EF-P lysine aminoacylase GenX [Candidatus Magasanikbacteria bacterium RIFCSPLOWO2_12_FULL_47_9b]|nr:MAG: EF-P lysine aminoacylase GenX [Candidatus Magasanikbacteria bacterium RIFCSPLOWO2_02_FULL_47_16]OGH79717.1 MAG: EF-P lysine aminoacylase GenX [Candidatus Magasanikbacteria bacterium RIFCSPHIGHO2_02_FULL_48_18]OGH82043.1 MAG: EF-P lysine aminoacylase GenX [Candidatus Magasanikbacteria bacterium RIFCSPLOWO2_12_FULL_47_9b]